MKITATDNVCKHSPCAAAGNISQHPNVETNGTVNSTQSVSSTPSTPVKAAVTQDMDTPPKSNVTSPHRGGSGLITSSSKRRRLATMDTENNCLSTPTNTHSFITGSPRKLNYEPRNNDSTSSEDFDSDDDDDDEKEEDPIEQEIIQMRQQSLLKKMRRVNGEDDEDQLMHTTATAKLFEYVDSKWKQQGSGCVKFIKCLEEGYNCGMIRMELTKAGTLTTLMRCELTNEEVLPMKKGNAYTWRCKDWASSTTVKTFALRFSDGIMALNFKAEVESSKLNNCRVRRGLDIPDVHAVDDICSSFQNSTTLSSPKVTSV